MLFVQKYIIFGPTHRSRVKGAGCVFLVANSVAGQSPL